MPQPWDIQHSETPEAYHAFTAFRDLGPTRSLDKAYRTQTGRTTRAPGRWKTWHRQHNWKARAAALDRHQQEVGQVAAEAAVAAYAAASAEARLEQLRREQAWQFIIDRKIQEMDKVPIVKRRIGRYDDGRPFSVEEPARWTLKTMLEFIRFGRNLGRMTNKMPTVVDDEAPADDLKELFFETDGQLESKLPDGAMPPMPPDVMAKPDIPASTDAAGQAPPTQPPPLPPEIGRGSR
jgi:hypothetical protein